MDVVNARICPRCLGYIPSNEEPGAYPGAGSRYNRSIEICSWCGVDEAMGRGVIPPDQWPIDLGPKPERPTFMGDWSPQ